MSKDQPTTELCYSTENDVIIRGKSLPLEIIGQRSFTEMFVFLVTGEEPTPSQTAMVDGCLVTLMEHGLTPTAISARLTYTSAPEAMQGAVAAGLLSVGSLFVGTVEGCAVLLGRIARADDAETEASSIVAEFRDAGERIPGFGHPVHRPRDPRTQALRSLASDKDLHGPHWEALATLAATLEEALGRPLPPNATGAIAAALSDCGIPAEILRGFALVSRAAGLVAHIHEEQKRPAMRALWAGAEAAVPYAPEEDS